MMKQSAVFRRSMDDAMCFSKKLCVCRNQLAAILIEVETMMKHVETLARVVVDKPILEEKKIENLSFV